MIIPFAEFAPDQPDLGDATNIASGCVALTPQSYGPLSSLGAFTQNTLDSGCLGMIGCDDASETSHIFAGTTKKLWHNTFGSTSWQDVSGSTYAPASGENWRFAQFKQIMLATDFSDAIQSYTMGSSATFGELSSAAPKARYIAVAKDFCIVANTYDQTGGLGPYRIWWSAVGDPTNWPTPGSDAAQQVMSDYSDLAGPQGAITGLAPNLSGCDCAVFFERGVFRMYFSGPPDVFDFYPAQGVRGCSAPNSIVTLGELCYYLDEDGFYAFDGNQAIPIGAQKVDKWFLTLVDQAYRNLIIGAADINNKAILWAFKSIYATSARPDYLLIYRWDIKRWSYAQLPMQWLARVAVPATIGAGAPTVFGLSAGQLQVAAVNPAGNLSFFNGPYLPAQIGTKVAQLTPGRRSFVRSVRPVVNSGGQSLALQAESGLDLLTESGGTLMSESGFPPTITTALSARVNYQDLESFGPDIGIDAMGECPQRSDGRYHRARVTISGNSIWSQALGVEPTFIPAGLR